MVCGLFRNNEGHAMVALVFQSNVGSERGWEMQIILFEPAALIVGSGGGRNLKVSFSGSDTCVVFFIKF